MSAPGPRLGLIWAEARGGVIGKDGGMPWHVPEDLAHFKERTTGHPVIMGRRTWESFPERFRPLPDRRNIVVTTDAEWAADGAERASSLDEALAQAVVDVSGRPYCVHRGEPAIMRHTLISSHGGASYDTVMNRHVFESFAMNAGICLHIRVLDGRDPHHITEAEFKALARALREATERDPRITGIPSTKGAL